MVCMVILARVLDGWLIESLKPQAGAHLLYVCLKVAVVTVGQVEVSLIYIFTLVTHASVPV